MISNGQTHHKEHGMSVFPLFRWENQHLERFFNYQWHHREKAETEFSPGPPGLCLVWAHACGSTLLSLQPWCIPPLFSNSLWAIGAVTRRGKGKPLPPPLLRQRTVIKVRLQAPWFLTPLWGREWLPLAATHDLGLFQGVSDSAGVLGYCSKVSLVSLGPLVPCHAMKSCCLGQNWLRDWILGSTLHPGLGCPGAPQAQRWPPTTGASEGGLARSRTGAHSEGTALACPPLRALCAGFVLSSGVKAPSSITPLGTSSCEGAR